MTTCPVCDRSKDEMESIGSWTTSDQWALHLAKHAEEVPDTQIDRNDTDVIVEMIDTAKTIARVNNWPETCVKRNLLEHHCSDARALLWR